jgi:hypothetical protein
MLSRDQRRRAVGRLIDFAADGALDERTRDTRSAAARSSS